MYGFEPTVLLEDYRGSISQMNVHADEILVMKVKEGNMEDVEAGIAQRQEDLDATWANTCPRSMKLYRMPVSSKTASISCLSCLPTPTRPSLPLTR